MGYILKPSWLAATVIAVACSAQAALAAELPSDLCSLLAPADVTRIVGSPYGTAQSSVAPAPFVGTNTGTDCYYSAKGAGDQLWFRIYVDSSAAQATDLFARLKVAYNPSTPVPGIGDEAYFDKKHAIHVRKAQVRYYLQLGKEPSAERPLHDLANLVAGKL